MLADFYFYFFFFKQHISKYYIFICTFVFFKILFGDQLLIPSVTLVCFCHKATLGHASLSPTFEDKAHTNMFTFFCKTHRYLDEDRITHLTSERTIQNTKLSKH